ncbi:MAG: ABC transporter permease [Candidatus Pacebacteria bacterium]|nr:ABC transporter permease [Candidatus Paceibacterota bacterium]
MKLTADIFLALRYLRPKRTFVSIITLLSILGPALGVGVLIIVTSVMSGFDRDIRRQILAMQAHIQVQPAFASITDNHAVITDTNPILDKMAELHIQGAPLIESPVLLQSRDNIQIKYVRGIDPALEASVTDVAEHVRGRYKITEGEALIGSEMAYAMGVGIGDRILVHAPQKLTRNIKWPEDGTVKVQETDTVYLPEEVTVAGIFTMGLYEYDSTMLFMHIDQAAQLFGIDWGAATSIHARTPDPFALEKETATLREAFPEYRIVTWQEANRQLFSALRVEKNLMFLVLSFIVIVAAFCIAGTLITVVTQKTREIAILKAVGMGGMMVARIFMLQGAIIGLLGTLLGLTLGTLVVHYRNQVAAVLAQVMGVEIFPKELYHLSQIPALIKPSDLALIISLAFVICILASLLPALYASLLSPARALQDEN